MQVRGNKRGCFFNLPINLIIWVDYNALPTPRAKNKADLGGFLPIYKNFKIINLFEYFMKFYLWSISQSELFVSKMFGFYSNVFNTCLLIFLRIAIFCVFVFLSLQFRGERSAKFFQNAEYLNNMRLDSNIIRNHRIIPI